MGMNPGPWADAAARLQRTGAPYAIATVIATAGSTPRDAGSKIVVSADDTWDSIGGGQLEYLVVNRAREMLRAGWPQQEIKPFPLAAEVGQCCGGSVAVLLEAFVPADAQVAIFGGGHVAQALVGILSETALSILWLDSRPEFLDGAPSRANVYCQVLAAPETAIDTLPSGCQVLVLTHDHALDYRLVKRLLEPMRFAFVGLIGSATKARRFRRRLRADGLSPALIERLECPVGLPAVKGKLPMEVAVSIAAGLLSRLPNDGGARQRGMSWPTMRDALREVEATGGG